MIEDICIKIIDVLDRVAESNWIITFKWIIDNPENLESETMKREIRKIYLGGMGSFNDLVLSNKNGEVYIEENNELNKLRDELYIEITKGGNVPNGAFEKNEI